MCENTTFKVCETYIIINDSCESLRNKYTSISYLSVEDIAKQRMSKLIEAGGYLVKLIKCVRTNKIYYISFYIDVKNQLMMKVGQYPSLADFQIAKIRDYGSVLAKDFLKELTRAIGLYANGIGVGSFVYLRRIFEKLIEDAYLKAQNEGNFDDVEYQNKRMVDKIDSLKEYLPDFLVQHKSMYAILSKGIHELSEEECLEGFPIVRVGIELILDEKIEKEKQLKKKIEGEKMINAFHQKLNKKK